MCLTPLPQVGRGRFKHDPYGSSPYSDVHHRGPKPRYPHHGVSRAHGGHGRGAAVLAGYLGPGPDMGYGSGIPVGYGGRTGGGPPSLPPTRGMSKFRTKLCSFFMDSGGLFCPHGGDCQFAHGYEDIRVPGTGGLPSQHAPPHLISLLKTAAAKRAAMGSPVSVLEDPLATLHSVDASSASEWAAGLGGGAHTPYGGGYNAGHHFPHHHTGGSTAPDSDGRGRQVHPTAPPTSYSHAPTPLDGYSAHHWGGSTGSYGHGRDAPPGFGATLAGYGRGSLDSTAHGGSSSYEDRAGGGGGYGSAGGVGVGYGGPAYDTTTRAGGYLHSLHGQGAHQPSYEHPLAHYEQGHQRQPHTASAAQQAHINVTTGLDFDIDEAGGVGGAARPPPSTSTGGAPRSPPDTPGKPGASPLLGPGAYPNHPWVGASGEGPPAPSGYDVSTVVDGLAASMAHGMHIGSGGRGASS